MTAIIAQPGTDAHAHPDLAARRRRDRLARATAEQMEAALAFLSAVDPEAFEIAFTAVAPVTGEGSGDGPAGDPEDGGAVPVCRECGGLVGIFLGRGPGWQHFRGDWVTAGAQEIYDPGHAAVVTWILSGEAQAGR